MAGHFGSVSWFWRATGSIYSLSPQLVPYFQTQGQQKAICLPGQSSGKVDSSFRQSLGSPEDAHLADASLGDCPH